MTKRQAIRKAMFGENAAARENAEKEQIELIGEAASVAVAEEAGAE